MLPQIPLGNTELVVSPLGLGLAAVGRPAYINLTRQLDDRDPDSLRTRAHQLLDAAAEAGIRYFDAARSYGRAEEFLGSWLTGRTDSGEMTVGSKWGYRYVGGWRMDAEVHEVKDHSVDALRSQLSESRGHLGRHLDLYQIHSATPDTGVLDDHEVLSELVALAESGVRVGLSVSGPTQADTIRQALETTVAGVNPFSCVQATWNLLERSAGPALAEAHAAGWGVIVKEGLANGRLATSEHAPAPVTELARDRGVGADAIALAVALAQPWSHVVLSGPTSVDQLLSNLTATTIDLTPESIANLDGLVQEPGAYWRARSDLDWH